MSGGRMTAVALLAAALLLVPSGAAAFAEGSASPSPSATLPACHNLPADDGHPIRVAEALTVSGSADAGGSQGGADSAGGGSAWSAAAPAAGAAFLAFAAVAAYRRKRGKR